MDHMKAAIELRNKTTARIDAIRKDPDLSDKKKAEMIAAVREPANQSLTDARDKHKADRITQHETLRRRLFGLNHRSSMTEQEKQTAIISYRDALFKVRDLETEDEALRMLQRSNLAGDRILSKAIAAISYEKGWGKALNSYASATDKSATLTELGSLEQSERNRTRQFNESVAFQQIPESDLERDARLSRNPEVLGAAPGSRDAMPRG